MSAAPLDPNGEPIRYKFDRTVATVTDLWREWPLGLGALYPAAGFGLGGQVEGPKRAAILQPSPANNPGHPAAACVRPSLLPDGSGG